MTARYLCAAISTLASCYAPNAQPGSPCTDTPCPSNLVCSPVTQRCERAGGDGSGNLDGPTLGDGDHPDDAAPDGPPPVDANPLCKSDATFGICLHAMPTGSITLNSAIDTAAGASCLATGTFDAIPPIDVCVIAATNLKVNGTVRATGARPLVLVAFGALTIRSGTLDVSSSSGSAGAAATLGPCTPGTAPTGVQGGPGGSYGTAGGDTSAGAAGSTEPLGLRGGCAGLDGSGSGAYSPGGGGGKGGGAVLALATMEISVNGTIDASGAGGAANFGGGGGGGTGGTIVLDSPAVTFGLSAKVYANGGGGGGGSTFAPGSGNGQDGQSVTTAAAGGTSALGGAGGNGFAIGHPATDGANGTAPYAGGGGGGGGGTIKIYGAAIGVTATNTSPAPL